MPVRVCFAFNIESRLGLDLSDDVVPPQRKQLVLINRHELEAARRRAHEETQAALARMLLFPPTVVDAARTEKGYCR